MKNRFYVVILGEERSGDSTINFYEEQKPTENNANRAERRRNGRETVKKTYPPPFKN